MSVNIKQPFEGLKVIDLTTYLAAPLSARLMADFGADVIKIESFKGDPYRTYGAAMKCPVKDDQNPWVIREEGITEGKSAVGELRNMFAGAGGIHKFLLMGEPEDIARGEVFLKANYPKLSVLRSNSYYLEVMDGSVDKAEGVRFLCDRYGIPISRAAAFGDGENDLGMLRAAGYGFAMGNASEKLKARVGHTTLSNEEDGILRVLERIEVPKKAY